MTSTCCPAPVTSPFYAGTSKVRREFQTRLWGWEESTASRYPLLIRTSTSLLVRIGKSLSGTSESHKQKEPLSPVQTWESLKSYFRLLFKALESCLQLEVRTVWSASTSSTDGTIRLWDANDYSVKSRCINGEANISGVYPTCSMFTDEVILSGWSDGKIRAFRVDNN